MAAILNRSQTTVSSGVTLFRAGNPIRTDAVIKDFSNSKFDTCTKIGAFSEITLEGATKLQLPLSHKDRVFGLGENIGSLNRRGRVYRFFAKDDGLHTPEKRGIYSSHPVVYIIGETCRGFFIDFPGEMLFDVGCNDRDIFDVFITSTDFDLYWFEGKNPRELFQAYLDLVGQPYLPPRWALGYHQSRYSYPDDKTVREVLSSLREHRIPCDAIHTDIHYMQDYKVFTVNQERFPDIKKLALDARQQGVRLVPIIDPGIHIEQGYETYDTGIREDVFCKTASGENFVGAVWPGLVHFPDFMNPKTREWWGKQYAFFLELGITDFWNDMNEPGIFYTPEGLDQMRAIVKAVEGKYDLDIHAVDFIEKMGAFWHSEAYFKEFYHTTWMSESAPQKIRHDKVRNLYGFNMLRATADGVNKMLPDERHFYLTRSSYPGAHRYGALWYGDNHSWWQHMEQHLQMLISTNLCGFYFSGADIGGFNGDCSADLMVRWSQLGIFSPFFRNHSTIGSRPQEPWSYDAATLKRAGDSIRMRYALLPQLYSAYLKSLSDRIPVIRAVWFSNPNEHSLQVEDQFYFGDSILVAPVHETNAIGRYVYLPDVPHLHWSITSYDERNINILPAGYHYVKADLHEIPVFIPRDNFICITPPVMSAGKLSIKNLELVGLIDTEAFFELLWDDGKTPQTPVSRLKISIHFDGSAVKGSLVEKTGIIDTEKIKIKAFRPDGRYFETNLELSVKAP